MKDKNLAGILALFFGWLGIHRFYLGQVGLGILYIMFFWISWMFSLVDAIIFFSMDKDDFDIKYNREFYKVVRRERDSESDHNREKYRSRRMSEAQQRKAQERTPQKPREFQTEQAGGRKHNPYKQSGIIKFRDFDYQGAIKDFEKALEIDPKDVAIHFNLACAFSLDEKTDKSLFHLDKAVELGFNDFDRIKEHDALAFLRIQKEFESFEKNGYRLEDKLDLNITLSEDKPLIDTSEDLLQQLNKLAELKEKGLLSQEEFERQKQKLLNKND